MIDLSGTVHVGTALLPGVEAAINKEGSTFDSYNFVLRIRMNVQ
jgi:hypothetical protein